MSGNVNTWTFPINNSGEIKQLKFLKYEKKF